MVQQVNPMEAGTSGAGKRKAVCDAAIQAFIEDGYAASMDSIASRAGVAKQTLYNQFGSKEQLFAEVIRLNVDAITLSLDGPDFDLRVSLLRFVEAFRYRALSQWGLGLHRALIAEAPRFPKLARLIFETGPASARDALARFLRLAMESGQLRKVDAHFAAELLMSMVAGFERVRLLYGVKADPVALNEKQRCAAIVDCFLNGLAIE